MKYALISDVHGNLPALEAVLTDIDRRDDVDAAYHLGDLVGYVSWPDEVVALIKERGIMGIAGNYDSTVATDYEHCGCNADNPRGEELAHLSYGWTREQVAPETKRFLGSLPFRMDLRPRGGHVRRPRGRGLHEPGALLGPRPAERDLSRLVGLLGRPRGGGRARRPPLRVRAGGAATQARRQESPSVGRSITPNFLEPPRREVRGTPLPRTWVNQGC